VRAQLHGGRPARRARPPRPCAPGPAHRGRSSGRTAGPGRPPAPGGRVPRPLGPALGGGGVSVQAFDIAAFLVASARDSLEAPPVYGALRMFDAAARLADLDPDDDHLRDLGRRFADLRTLIMDDQDAFAARLDDLLAEIA